MNDRDLLLAAILANPDEDTPRLMFADAIQDEEPERAEFIRVQVELARVGTSPDPFCLNCYGGGGCPHFPDGIGGRKILTPCRACYKKLRDRENKLHNTAAAVTWRKLPWGMSSRSDCVRGFVECVHCSPPDWLTHADEVLANLPIQSVILREGQVPWGSRLVEDGLADYYLLPKSKCKREGKPVRLQRIGITQKQIIRACLKAEWPSLHFVLPDDRMDWLTGQLVAPMS